MAQNLDIAALPIMPGTRIGGARDAGLGLSTAGEVRVKGDDR